MRSLSVTERRAVGGGILNLGNVGDGADSVEMASCLGLVGGLDDGDAGKIGGWWWRVRRSGR